MKAGVSTIGMSRDTWLEERRRGIGGSDSPVILLGENHPFTTPVELWKEKRGLSGPQSESPAMKRGKALEDLIAREYAEATGRKIRRVNQVLQHPDHPWMLGNIDRLIVGVAGRDPGVLEIKCPGLKVFLKIKREGIPDYYLIQLQHYLAVSGRKWGAFAVFNAELWELIHFDMDRDDDLIAAIISRGGEFWNLVETGVPPQVGKELTKLDLPKVGENDSFLILESDAWKRAVSEYREARDVLAQAKELEEEAKDRIGNIMKLHNATVVEGAGVRVHKIVSKGRETFDHKGFFKVHPELSEERMKFVKVGAPSESIRPYFLKEEKQYE